jgi:DNA-directed RNA polymerase subunit RPC12/RpoP
MTKDTVRLGKVLFAFIGTICVFAASASAVTHYYCKYCGHKAMSVNSLTASSCQRHPNGPGAGRHALYEGGEKATYVCKYCGLKSTSIASLTSSKCQRHPNGPAKGRHEPTL